VNASGGKSLILTKGKKGKKRSGGKVMRESSEQGLARCPPIPPTFNPVPVRECRRRFLQNAAVTNQAFTLANGHDQFLVVTSTLGAAVPFVDCWRIKKIYVWCISEGDFATSVTLTPVGADISSNNFNDRERAYAISSRSVSEPGYMCLKTAKDQPMGSWHFTSNTNFAGTLFQVNVGINGGTNNMRCTMDIVFQYVENFLGLPLGYGRTTATTTLGAVGGEGILSGFAPQNVNNLG
jgi:hypothetical protein